MSRFVFELSSYTLKTFSGFSHADIKISGQENIPEGSVIFTANHFTRIETVFLPYHIHQLTKKEVWSLAAAELFKVPILEGFLNQLGAVSTQHPDRDELILKTLLSGKVQWVIFPEGRMVKNKKHIIKDRFVVKDDESVSRPHTGAAVTALRCAFYRERIRRMKQMQEPEFDRLSQRFEINDIDTVLEQQTYIVPVNITYYPAGARENFLSKIGKILMKTPSKRVLDELMTEGSVLFKDVEINIRFGDPISIKGYMNDPYIESMLTVKRKIRFEQDLSSKQIFKDFAARIMEAYMGSVYNMTTLNYDHVMACVLKHFPYRENGIDPYEFKCKVFYAVTELAAEKRYFVSDSFNENQIHLLVNDPHHRVENFLKLAVETGVITLEQGRIFKDQTRFDIRSGFHEIRIENPILVVANEVEPVKDAEQRIKKIAQMTEDEIRIKVKDRLIEKSQVDFSTDYNRYFDENESKRKRIGRPIFLRPLKQKAGVLLIHGYLSAPREMLLFAEYLKDLGYYVYVPRLKGHGTSPKDLASTTYEQWIESVEEAFVILRHTCSKIFVGGFSTGAGLALEMATKDEDICAVFAVAPPMHLKDLGSYFAPAISAWNAMIEKIHLDAAAKKFIDTHIENPQINYTRNPIAGIRQLEKLMEQLESKLKTVTQPTLVVQSRKDPVVSPKGTLKLFEKLGCTFKEYYIFDYDRHSILFGDNVSRVYSAISNFLEQWLCREHSAD